MPILQSTISSSAQIHLHPAFFVFHYPSLIPLFLSLHYLPSRLSNRFIPLSPCSRSLCNYFVLVCIPVTIPPCRFVSHLSLSRFIVCVLHTLVPQPSFLFCSLVVDMLPWILHYSTASSSFCVFLFYMCLFLPIFLPGSLLPYFPPPSLFSSSIPLLRPLLPSPHTLYQFN